VSKRYEDDTKLYDKILHKITDNADVVSAGEQIYMPFGFVSVLSRFGLTWNATEYIPSFSIIVK
jgi:hypothetical protein